MEKKNRSSVVTLRDADGGGRVTLSVDEREEYLIGLTTTGALDSCECHDEMNNICVPLVKLEIKGPKDGYILSPANRDLPCQVNHNYIHSEVNLKSGSVIDVADQTLTFIEGPVPLPRRKLPTTPGMRVQPETPSKPCCNSLPEIDQNIKVNDDDISLSDWHIVESSLLDEEFIEYLETTEQISNMAASLFSRQLLLYTDANTSTELIDNVYKLFQTVGQQNMDLMQTYLYELCEEARKDENFASRQIQGPSIRLVIGLLKHTLDPVSHVIMCLELLRIFSHFEQNLKILVDHKAVASVLGCMAAHSKHALVQQYGLEFLAKLSTYHPTLGEKPPIRETAVDMVLWAADLHQSELNVLQPVCRTLANLILCIYEVIHHILNTMLPTQEVGEDLGALEEIIDHLAQYSIPVIQKLMQRYPGNLIIQAEGRRAYFIYTRLEHLRTKKRLWLENKSCPRIKKPSTSSSDGLSSGILKRGGSVENLRKPDRHVQFFHAISYESSSSEDLADEAAKDSLEKSKIEAGQQERKHSDRIGFESDEADLRVTKTVIFSEACSNELSQSLAGSNFLNHGSSSEEKMSKKGPETVSTDWTEVGGSSVDKQASQPPSLATLDTAETPPEIPPRQKSGVGPAADDSDRSYSNNCPKTPPRTYRFSCKSSDPNDGDLKPSLPPRSHKPFNERKNDIFALVENNKKKVQQSQPLVKESVIDVEMYYELVRYQIVISICCLVAKDQDATVLKIIDQPVSDVLVAAEASTELQNFLQRQKKSNLSLIDVDTSLVINIIDAVRYKTLANKLLQKMVLNSLTSITANHIPDVIKLTVNLFASVFSNELLYPMLKDKEFLNNVEDAMSKLVLPEEYCRDFPEIKQRIKTLSAKS